MGPCACHTGFEHPYAKTVETAYSEPVQHAVRLPMSPLGFSPYRTCKTARELNVTRALDITPQKTTKWYKLVNYGQLYARALGDGCS